MASNYFDRDGELDEELDEYEPIPEADAPVNCTASRSRKLNEPRPRVLV